jgi:hypothetical protein
LVPFLSLLLFESQLTNTGHQWSVFFCGGGCDSGLSPLGCTFLAHHTSLFPSRNSFLGVAKWLLASRMAFAASLGKGARAPVQQVRISLEPTYSLACDLIILVNVQGNYRQHRLRHGNSSDMLSLVRAGGLQQQTVGHILAPPIASSGKISRYQHRGAKPARPSTSL